MKYAKRMESCFKLMDGGVERVGKKTLNGRSKVIDMSEIYIVHTSEIKYLKQIQ